MELTFEMASRQLWGGWQRGDSVLVGSSNPAHLLANRLALDITSEPPVAFEFYMKRELD
jgi:hypothetical protein